MDDVQSLEFESIPEPRLRYGLVQRASTSSRRGGRGWDTLLEHHPRIAVAGRDAEYGWSVAFLGVVTLSPGKQLLVETATNRDGHLLMALDVVFLTPVHHPMDAVSMRSEESSFDRIG